MSCCLLAIHAGVIAGAVHGLTVSSFVGLGVHVAERELDSKAHGASSTPSLIILCIVRTVGRALEAAGIKEIAAVERDGPGSENSSETEINAPTSLTGTLSRKHL